MPTSTKVKECPTGFIKQINLWEKFNDPRLVSGMYKSLKVHLCILTNQSTLHKATCSSCHYMQLECTNVTKDLYGKKLINGGNPLIQMTLKLRLILIQGEDCP